MPGYISAGRRDIGTAPLTAIDTYRNPDVHAQAVAAIQALLVEVGHSAYNVEAGGAFVVYLEPDDVIGCFAYSASGVPFGFDPNAPAS